MRKIAVQLGFVLAILALATTSHARIFVNISDGTNSLNGSNMTGCQVLDDPSCFVANFRLSRPSLALADSTLDQNDSMPLLFCSPCIVYFPSGARTQQAGDTFEFKDSNQAGPFARVVKFDGATSADMIRLRGVQIRSLTANRTLVLTYATQNGDLRTVFSNPYPATAAMSGSFQTSLGGRASACGALSGSSPPTSSDINTVSAPCVKLEIKVNGTTADGQGVSSVATIAVPCSPLTTSNPCGTAGSWTQADGSFVGVNDSQNMSCATPCTVNSRGVLTVVFKNANETLTMAASAHGAVGNRASQRGGLEENFLSLGDEETTLQPTTWTNRWVAYTGANRLCKAVATGSTITPGNNFNNQATLTSTFELWCGFLQPPPAPPNGYEMLSIVDLNEVTPANISTGPWGTPGNEIYLNDASRVTYLPVGGSLLVKNISELSFSYSVKTGPFPSGDNRVGVVSAEDCRNGSLRVELELQDFKTSPPSPAGTAKVYLGTTNKFQNTCQTFEDLIGSDLVGNRDARVDTSQVVGGSTNLLTFKQFQGKFGSLRVRKVAFVNDYGNGYNWDYGTNGQPATLCGPTNTSACRNHRVTFFDGRVNGVTASSSLQVVSPDATFRKVSNLPTSGVSMVIRKLTSNGQPLANPEVKVVLRDCAPDAPPSCVPDIVVNGQQFRGKTGIQSLQPDTNFPTKYSIDLCLNGQEEGIPSTNPPTPTGLCIPDQTILTTL